MNEVRATPRTCAALVFLLLMLVAIPTAITLRTVEDPGSLVITSTNPTPYGYTVSLLIFFVPIAVIAFWLLPQEKLSVPRRAFWTTIALLFPLGAGLDYFFAALFFTFLNPGATLGIHAPALHGWVPIEEYVFYLSGFLALLLMYVWLDEYWLHAYHVEDPDPRHSLVRFHFPSFAVGALLIAAGWIYKNYFTDSPGIPGYYIFLVLVAFIPSSLFLPAVLPYINWRAFSVAMFYMVLVSLLWEATLGVPYKWWGYQDARMLGIYVKAWSWLPLEAVLVWMAATYSTAITYTTVQRWYLAHGR